MREWSRTLAQYQRLQHVAATWVNGNLSQNSSLYLEGDSVPYRIVGDDVSIGPTHTVVIEWDTMKQTKHAIDFITTFNRTVADANPCLGVANCGTATTFPIPPDSAAGGFQIPGVLTMYGGSISAAVYSSRAGNDAPRRLTITFTQPSRTRCSPGAVISRLALTGVSGTRRRAFPARRSTHA